MSQPTQTILVVDDSATTLLSLQTLLRERGFEVVTARDGQEGMDLLRGGLNPDLIITDIAMPRMDGITFTRETRALLRFVPILVLTTESQRARREEGRSLGATGWLLKPVDVKALFALIEQILPGNGKVSGALPGSTLARLNDAVGVSVERPRTTQFTK